MQPKKFLFFYLYPVTNFRFRSSFSRGSPSQTNMSFHVSRLKKICFFGGPLSINVFVCRVNYHETQTKPEYNVYLLNSRSNFAFCWYSRLVRNLISCSSCRLDCFSSPPGRILRWTLSSPKTRTNELFESMRSMTMWTISLVWSSNSIVNWIATEKSKKLLSYFAYKEFHTVNVSQLTVTWSNDPNIQCVHYGNLEND